MASKKPLNVTDESRSTIMTIILLAWPVLVEQIFSTLVSFADTAMVGSMGKVATASISISNPPIFLLNGVFMSLGVGITALVARHTGHGGRIHQQFAHHALKRRGHGPGRGHHVPGCPSRGCRGA